MSQTVLMIGHSKHPWNEFVKLLQAHRVLCLVDVRTSPRSRWMPHFNAEALARQLAEIGVAYRHLPALGGKDPLPIPELRKTIAAELLPLAAGVCLMCSEGNHVECHRHYLLAPLFLELGIQVLQIDRSGSLTEDPGPTAATLERMRAFLP